MWMKARQAKIWIQMFWLQVPTPRSGQHEPGCHTDWVKSWFWKFIISLIIHSVMSDFATPWTVACQPPLSVGFPRQEYWSGGWGGRWEGGSGWGTHVNPWLIHVNVWQKPLQYCKVISLQLIKMGGKKKEYWSGLPFPSPRCLPGSGIGPTSPSLQADSSFLEHREAP